MNVCVIGDGGWGTALAMLLCENGHRVTLWSPFAEYARELQESRVNRKFLPGHRFPDTLTVTGAVDDLFEDCELALSVVPTQFLRQVAKRLGNVPLHVPFATATKGLELSTLSLPSQILHEELGSGRSVCVLTGPSHAEEVAQKKVTVVVAASQDEALAEIVQKACSNDRFRVYRSDDPLGVEFGGALKNIIAIAAGICDGLDLGDNAKAALITRGLVEMARYGVAHGARSETFAGLAGLGDLATTCYSGFGRNRSVGERLGRGETLDQILAGMEMVAEGVWTTKAIHENAAAAAVEMPITAEIYAVCFQGKDPREAVTDLMTRELRSE